MVMSDRYFGRYDTKTFADVFPDETTFVSSYAETKMPNLFKDQSTLTTIYYLLYAKYGRAHVATDDPFQFRAQIASIVFQYGPNWEKNIEIQKALRSLTHEQIVQGGKAIYNHAYNPGSEPTTATLEELTTINEQNVTNYKKNPVEGYAHLVALLEDDFTERFLAKFVTLFVVIMAPTSRLLYGVSDEEEDL
jgi:hypothetical protein